MNHKSLLILIAVFSFIVACKKEADQPPPIPPTSEPLTVAAAKPGDTLYIKGTSNVAAHIY
jgi:hypothetical protein